MLFFSFKEAWCEEDDGTVRVLKNKSLYIVTLLYVVMTGIFSPPLYGATFPEAYKEPKVQSLHGEQRVDNYFWLSNPNNPEVLKYLKLENNYTKKSMQASKPLQEKLYHELRERIPAEEFSIPEHKGSYFYYARTEQGQNYPVYCRKLGSMAAAEEILLDLNALAKGKTSIQLGILRVSPDHRYLAYALDTNGSENYTLYIKDLNTGIVLAPTRINIYPSLEWAEDSRTLFYIGLDATKRPYRLYRYQLGQDSSQDHLVYEEKEQAFFVNLSKTGSGQFLLLQLHSKDTAEVRYLQTSQPMGNFRVVQPRRKGVQYQVEQRGEYFYLATNEQAENFKLARVPIKSSKLARPEEILPHRKDVILEDFALFKDYLVVQERQAGLQKIRVLNLNNKESYYINFTEPAYEVSLLHMQNFERPILRYRYTSLSTPDAIYDYQMDSKRKELKKQVQVPGYCLSDYQCDRIMAKAQDGTNIPISLIYKKGLKRDGSNPLLLTGYGAYGYSYPVSFNAHRLSLLERGFVCAIAHIRGGQEMGRSWYEQGKLLQKKNTFTDFIACAEHLLREGYTGPGKLAITGGSAGGLLMGAVLNMRPDLFKAVVAQVPFVDVLNTMSDPALPLTVTEYDEWGNPRDKKYYDYIKSYSPYDNVQARNYPDMLVTAGLNDPRVGYWEPAKWVAKLRDYNTSGSLILLKTNMEGGHFGAGGRYSQLREIAFEYAFLIDRLGGNQAALK